ncbi:hypothetical protein [Microcoleus sp. Z1_B5]|uniref:hypothetical protein n=1 Tax=Microcoleus sp. Z1_B5 TaxID=3055430 RepID=UPI002FD0F472
MTQIPIPLTVEVSAAAATPGVTSASLYPSLLASAEKMADPELWVLMEAAVYSLRQRDTLARSIKECGTVECFGDKWPQDFDFLPSESEAIALVEAIADQFSSRQLHTCWQSLLTTCNRIQKLALIEAITYAQHYSSTVLQALSQCELSDLFEDSLEHLDVWLSEPEALRLIRLLSGSLLASSEAAPSPGDGRDDR